MAMLNFGVINLEAFSNIKMSESGNHLFEGVSRKRVVVHCWKQIVWYSGITCIEQKSFTT